MVATFYFVPKLVCFLPLLLLYCVYDYESIDAANFAVNEESFYCHSSHGFLADIGVIYLWLRQAIVWRRRSPRNNMCAIIPSAKWMKHGHMSLGFSRCAPEIDITICMDILANPGPRKSLDFGLVHEPCGLLKEEVHNLHTHGSLTLMYSEQEIYNIRLLCLHSASSALSVSKANNASNFRSECAGSRQQRRIPVRITQRRTPTRNFSDNFMPMAMHYQHAKNRTAKRNTRNLNNIISIERQRSKASSRASCKLFKFGVFNAKSINNKTESIKDLVLDNKIDMLALTETWLRSNENNDFVTRDVCPDGFVITHIPRSAGRGGGVGLLYKTSLKLEKLNSNHHFKSFEMQEVLLFVNSVLTRIVIIYRPQSTSTYGHSTSIFFDEFAVLLETLVLCPGKLILTGDFNIHVDDFSILFQSKLLHTESCVLSMLIIFAVIL